MIMAKGVEIPKFMADTYKAMEQGDRIAGRRFNEWLEWELKRAGRYDDDPNLKNHPTKIREVLEWAGPHITIPAGGFKTVADIACGTGMVAEALREKDLLAKEGRIIGVDYSKEMLKRAESSGRLDPKRGDEVHHATAEDMHMLGDSSLDFAASVEGLHPNHTDLPRFYAELMRVLKPGKSALISYQHTPNEIFPHTLPQNIDNWPHVRSAREAGFDVVARDHIQTKGGPEFVMVVRKPGRK